MVGWWVPLSSCIQVSLSFSDFTMSCPAFILKISSLRLLLEAHNCPSCFLLLSSRLSLDLSSICSSLYLRLSLSHSWYPIVPQFPHCFPFRCCSKSYASAHALFFYCSFSTLLFLAFIVFPMYLGSSVCYLETLVSASCLQVSTPIFRSVDTSLNTSLFSSPACQA